MPKVFISSDHAGYELKGKLIPFIKSLEYEVEDVGAYSFDSGDDYPTFITPCAEKTAAEPGSFGVIIGGSGQGEAMAANRIKNARAAVFYGGTMDIVPLARQHNDANLLSLGARFITEDEAKDAVKLFLTTPFSQELRHARRIAEY